jgi:hypothetical protein
MKTILLALLTISGLTGYGDTESTYPFDEIITKELFIQFSNYDQPPRLRIQKKEKEGFTEYHLAPLSGISIRVGQAYSFLPKSRIEEDRKSISESMEELEKALEAKKAELTEGEYQEMKKSLKLFHVIMAGSSEDRYPELGSQALQTGWTDGDMIVFTTTDKMYDVEIKRMFSEEVFFRVPEIAQRISDTHDNAKTQPAGAINSEAAASPR